MLCPNVHEAPFPHTRDLETHSIATSAVSPMVQAQVPSVFLRHICTSNSITALVQQHLILSGTISNADYSTWPA